ncbi:hypothetical protein F5051DRAFT_432531 [Lentinula edodes]|nr:hypothetical protein F5051DRAFT_432531 [Lentinula edodes]
MIRGFCHLAIGQGAVSVGLEHGINKNDKVITSYRCHPLAVLREGTIRDVIGELIGRQIGTFRGKGSARRRYRLCSQKYTEEATCTFAMYGDGAAIQVFEAFNIEMDSRKLLEFVTVVATQCRTLVLSTVLARKFRGCEVCKTFMASNVIFRSGNLLDLKQIDKDAIEEVTDTLLNTQLCRN